MVHFLQCYKNTSNKIWVITINHVKENRLQRQSPGGLLTGVHLHEKKTSWLKTKYNTAAEHKLPQAIK